MFLRWAVPAAMFVVSLVAISEGYTLSGASMIAMGILTPWVLA
jgi:hypothetical protein